MEDPADSDLQVQKIVNQNDTDLVGIQNFLCFLCEWKTPILLGTSLNNCKLLTSISNSDVFFLPCVSRVLM